MHEVVFLYVSNKAFAFSLLYIHFHKILRLFYVLPNFNFTASEMMGNYYLKHDIDELLHDFPIDLRLRILGN